MHEVKYYIGTDEDTPKWDARKVIRNLALESFMGFTLLEGEGGWKGNLEPYSFVVVNFREEAPFVDKDFIKGVKDALNQDEVLVSINTPETLSL